MNQAYRDLKESLVGGSPSEVFLAGMAFDKLVEEYERYEEALRQIANDSRPCLWDADHAAEHWKHVASQRREWAIEALHHISLKDTNEEDTNEPYKHCGENGYACGCCRRCIPD
jgi:hypothetical protein